MSSSVPPDGWLVPTPPQQLEPDERFAGLDAQVVEFWRWAFSDLRDNTVRGVLAEFLVAAALGRTNTRRKGWDNYDVLSNKEPASRSRHRDICRAGHRPSRPAWTSAVSPRAPGTRTPTSTAPRPRSAPTCSSSPERNPRKQGCRRQARLAPAVRQFVQPNFHYQSFRILRGKQINAPYRNKICGYNCERSKRNDYSGCVADFIHIMHV